MSGRALGVTIAVAGLAVAGLVLGLGLAPSPAILGTAALLALSTIAVARLAGLHLRRLTVPGVWYLTYVAGTFIPAFFVAADQNTSYVGGYLLAVTSVLVTAPFGMFLVIRAARFRPQEVSGFFAAPLDRTPPGPPATASYILVLAICLALTAAYVIETPVIPLFYLLQNPGSAKVLVGLREESFKLLDSPFLYAYDVLRRVIYPFLIALSLGYWLITRRWPWLVLFAITAGVGTLYGAFSIAKMPVAVIVLVVCLFLYLYVGGRIGFRAVLAGFSAVFLFPVAVLISSLEGTGLRPIAVVRGIFHRLFYLPAEILYYYFELVPDTLPYLHGRTIGRFSWILGEPQFDIANYVFQYMFPGGVGTGVATAPFVGYLHADFGLIGVLVGGVAVGMVVQVIQVILARRPKTVMTLAAFAYMYWCGWQINTESLTQALLSGGILVIFALVGVLRLLEGFFRAATARPVAAVPNR